VRVDIEPDATQAAHDRRALGRLTLGALRRAELVSPAGGSGVDVDHPAVIEIAHLAQQALRRGPLTPQRYDELAAALIRVREATTPARRVRGWSPELPAEQPHLTRSVARALADVPGGPARGAGSATSEVTAWTDAERATFDEAAGILEAVWPEMLDELAYTVRQIALLSGTAIDGFTDFGVHGAVFLGRERLARVPNGSSGPLVLVEAIVHEGTHQRCNAALISTPLWHRDADRSGAVSTPLRADPRPLGGLFHQMVVLARGASLYRRLLDAVPGRAPDPAPLRAAYARHRDDVRRAAETLDAHRASLTDAGLRVLDQAASGSAR